MTKFYYDLQKMFQTATSADDIFVTVIQGLPGAKGERGLKGDPGLPV